MPELGWIAADFATRSAKPAGMPVSVTWHDEMLWLVLGYRYGDGEQMSDGRGLSAGWKHGRSQEDNWFTRRGATYSRQLKKC